MSDSWKDEHREHKQQTGLSWEEYHERYFHHEHEIEDLRTSVEQLDEHLQAVTEAYDELRRELFEVKEFVKAREGER